MSEAKNPRPTPKPATPTQDEREARLAAALRANLRRRKTPPNGGNPG